MTPEEKAVHENGIRLLNQMTGSIFSYRPTDIPAQILMKCAICHEKIAEHVELMKGDKSYGRFVCTECRDKLIAKSYTRYLKRSRGDQNKYVITAQQASYLMKAGKNVRPR